MKVTFDCSSNNFKPLSNLTTSRYVKLAYRELFQNAAGSRVVSRWFALNMVYELQDYRMLQGLVGVVGCPKDCSHTSCIVKWWFEPW